MKGTPMEMLERMRVLKTIKLGVEINEEQMAALNQFFSPIFFAMERLEKQTVVASTEGERENGDDTCYCVGPVHRNTCTHWVMPL